MHIALCSKAKCPSATSTHTCDQYHAYPKKYTLRQERTHAICTMCTTRNMHKGQSNPPLIQMWCQDLRLPTPGATAYRERPMNKSIRQNLWIKSPKSASIRYNPKNERQKLISKLSKAVKVKALSLQGFLRYWDCDYLVRIRLSLSVGK